MNEKSKRIKLHKRFSMAQRGCTVSMESIEDSETYKVKPNISVKRKQHIFNLMKARVSKIKIKEFRNKIHPEYIKIPQPDTCQEEMWAFANNLPTTAINKYVVRDILRRTEMKQHQNKYKDVVKRVVEEFSEEFVRVTHLAGVHFRVKPLDGSESHVVLKPYRFKGRTERYQEFLCNRNKIEKLLCKHYPLTRKILDLSNALPNLLIDFSKFRSRAFEIHSLRLRFSEEFNKGFDVVNNFYTAIFKSSIVYKQPIKNANRYLNAANTLLSIIISRILRNTIYHVIEITDDDLRIPFMQLHLYYKNDFELTPTAEEVFELYEDMVYKISECAKNFQTLGKENTGQCITVYIQTEFLEKSLGKIWMNLYTKYRNIDSHVASIKSNFIDLLQKNVEDYRSDLSFENGMLEVDFYKKLILKVDEIYLNEIYPIGVLNQSYCKINLEKVIENYIQLIGAKLGRQHLWENQDICRTFESLAARAEEIPETSQGLIDKGIYMATTSNDILADLDSRIKIMIAQIVALMEITNLSREHMRLNADSINWSRKIKPIIDSNAKLYENYKFEFEERLVNEVAQLHDDISEIIPYLSILNSMNDSKRAKSYINQMSNILVKIRNCETKKDWINSEEKIFKYPISRFVELEEVKAWVYNFYHLLKVCINWNRCLNAWLDGPFEFLVQADSEKIVYEYEAELNVTQKNYRNQLKQMAADNNPRRFQGSVDDPDPLNQPAPLQLCRQALVSIEAFKPSLRIMSIVCNPALLQRHWDEMSEIAGFDMTPNAGTTLRKIIAMDLTPNMEGYEIISAGAVKELQLITNLKKMISEWDEINFKTSVYKNTKLQILVSLEDIQVILDDHTIKTLTMRGSVFVKPYQEEVKAYYEKILCISSTIEAWNVVQNKWLKYLPIFSSNDINQQMPDETKLFEKVNETYNKHMGDIKKNPNVYKLAGENNLFESLNSCIGDLEKIGEGVHKYLERKRLYFPRFFFLSNEEMLGILSETKDPLKVVPYLKKCFDGINTVKFNNELELISIISNTQEIINLSKTINTVEVGGNVEKWLHSLEETIFETIHTLTCDSRRDYLIKEKGVWMLSWPQQVILVVTNMFFTAKIHAALQKNPKFTISDLLSNLNADFEIIINLLRDNCNGEIILTNINVLTIKTLIIIHGYLENVLKQMIEKRINSENDFIWLSTLRYYWEDSTKIRLLNNTLNYTNEYLGNHKRLVMTPLTERCFISLISAQNLHLNASLIGPASSGKTETVKDLANAIGIRCISFNCSKGINFKLLRNFLKGAAASETWLCLDEFNNIELEVTSVLSQQILVISETLKVKSKVVNFEGVDLNLTPSTFICLTMNINNNPKINLPDNLAVSFRTVALMVPDFSQIAQVILTSHGFKKAADLGRKISTTYKLCAQLLSNPNHYDFSLRSMKTVLQSCGEYDLKKDEISVVAEAINKIIKPHLLPEDLKPFNSILKDVFLWSDLNTQPDKIKLDSNRILELTKFLPNERFFEKIDVLNEMLGFKHGIILVGDTYTGKSTVVNVLADFLNDGGTEKICYEYINPKCVTLNQFYGEINPKTNEWVDGIFAQTFRKFATSTENTLKWIILDGPVDDVWPENINSVLDDNRKLCLSSGEIIPLAENMVVIFEVEDLAQASPSTISRCGIIYFESNTLNWSDVVNEWKSKQTTNWFQDNSNIISSYFNWMIEPCLGFIKEHCKELCYTGPHSLVKNVCDLTEMILNDACDDDDSKYIIPWIQATIISAGVSGFCATLDLNSRKKFDEFYRSLWKNENANHKYPSGIPRLEMLLPPTDGLLLDYYYVYKLKGSWKFWHETVRSQRVEESDNVPNTLIPTLETAKYGNLLQKHIENRKKMLLVGPSGTGKSFLIRDILENRLDGGKYEASYLNFISDTTTNKTSELILSKLHKKKKGYFGPQKGKLAVMFIDDLNTLDVDICNNQTPLELLRYLFNHEKIYDLKELYEIYLHDILFMASMRSTKTYSKRFLRHFNIFYIDDISEESISKIFNNTLYLSYKNNGFQNDAFNAVPTIVSATLSVYKSALEKLLPTPNKIHYLFNIRDFSRVILGCTLLKKESTEDKRIFSKVWIHETMRVFYDRLIDEKDRSFLFCKIKEATEEYFKENLETIFEDVIVGDKEEFTEVDLVNYSFADFSNSNNYEEYNKEKIQEIAINSLKEYHAENRINLDLVFFESALTHLARISRILTIPSCSGLLIGMHGLGRQSLTKLATFMAKFSFFQPEIMRGYDIKNWRADLKEVLKEAGGRGNNSAFLISDHQILDPIFLQDIDSLLNIGEVPNMFAMDEKQEILEMVRLDAQGGNRNLDITATTVFTYFIKRCKEKLHIILCLNPINKNYRRWLTVHPSLIKNCVIDYFDEWPEDSLESLARSWISSVELDEGIQMKTLDAFKKFHAQAKLISEEFYLKTSMRTYVTASTYIELVKSFKYLITTKREEIKTNKNRYLAGLDKLQNAANTVATMQADLADFQPQLQEMTNRAAEMTRQIAKETIEVEKASAIVREDEKLANIQAANSQYLKRECEADLADAIPILEDAIEALNTLKPSDITLVKSMKNPPEAVKLVMAGVCVMRDIKPDRINDASTGGKILDYWGPSKRLLGDMNFLQHLKDFDKDHIKLEIMSKIRKEYLPNKLFKPHIVAKASSAAEGLCKWIIAMDMYDAVAKEVAPKKEKLELAEKEYQTTAAFLMEKKQQLAKLEEKLANLNDALDEAKAKQKELQNNVNICAHKLLRAEKLLKSLGGEKVKWIKASDYLQSLLDTLSGNILICSGLVAYLSPYYYEFRLKYTKQFHEYVKELEIPCSDEFDFCGILGSDSKIQHWQINGLPRNVFSLQNAIIQDVSTRWTLLIDPECQGNIWIKKVEKQNGLLITKFSNDFIQTLKTGLQLGKPVLIENIFEDFEPTLEPILNKQAKQLCFAKTTLTVNENFRLYLTTKLRKPHYLPHVANKLNLINFGIMLDGLKDQLLDIVVAKERPELQKQREELIFKTAKNKAALVDVEENILKTLSESKGDILEDESAIEALDNSKLLSLDVIANQEELKLQENNIENERNVFSKISTNSALLYNTIADLPNIDPMYQFSLEWFINLYVRSIEAANKSKALERRLRYLQETFMFNLYSTVCMALFESDRIVFAFILCCKIQLAKGNISELELSFLLSLKIDKAANDPKPYCWLTDEQWKQICALTDIGIFEEFIGDFIKFEDEWKYFYNTENLPLQWKNKLSIFHKLILTKIFHIDKFYKKATEFISAEIGELFIKPPPFDLSKSFEISTCICPLVFILSPGEDPMAALQKFSEKKQMSKKFHSISMGQQQQSTALNMIKDAQVNGNWVCLQNCHVNTKWLPDLERLMENINLSNTHTNFRLWMTTCSTKEFPISILQSSVKMTKQTPVELKENLLEAYTSEPVTNPDFFTACPAREDQFAKLLYGVTYFHHVIQKRLPFYKFTKTDYNISIVQLQCFINNYNQVIFDAIPYLISECFYGGKLTDCWDLRLLKTLFRDFFNSEFKFKFNSYGLPKRFNYDDYLEHIKKIPSVKKHEIYGIHENVQVLENIKMGNYLLKTMRLIQGEVSCILHNDSVLQNLCNNLIEKLAPVSNTSFETSFDPDSETFLNIGSEFFEIFVQETRKIKFLLSEVISSLSDLQNALKGSIQINETLQAIADCLLKLEVPKTWKRIAYPNLKNLPQFVDDLISRVRFFQSWYNTGAPAIFNISSFFNPSAFLTTIKQNHSRKHGISIDELMIDFEVMDFEEVDTKEEETFATVSKQSTGILIDGLYLVGASWDRNYGKLQELQTKIYYDKMPVITVSVCLKTEFKTLEKYECPMFITSERRGVISTSRCFSNFVISVWLKSALEFDHCVNRNVALLCQKE